MSYYTLVAVRINTLIFALQHKRSENILLYLTFVPLHHDAIGLVWYLYEYMRE